MHGISKLIRGTTIAGVLMAARSSQAQNDGASAKGEAVLVKLAPPTYPPLARQTRISGDVQVDVEVRPDGSVAKATVLQGHPLLAPAALESAKSSKFECRNCSEKMLSYRLVFTFETSTEREPCPGEKAPNLTEQPFPRVGQSGNHITVTERPVIICDPASTISRTKVRSVKCLFLWKCGWRVEYPL
jgi:TonB family protein